ncbi:copper resistance CopC family protein [Pseudonocardia sp. N23]|uniref:copper resistance CopC family protein n=1 Tax=Pseudonocardia sp. N23 TaxID=1987376 RepID=UPI000BFD1711|nr:copper resistance CopC family protein [Pseudonocardia sp. N23]GAY12603.1 copper resistance protein CopC [Pseudonocardia sp. N23]
MTTVDPKPPTRPRRAAAWLVRVAAAAAVAALIVLGTATPALAHDELGSSTPANGAQLATAPDAARLVFSAPLDPLFVQTAVTTPDGSRWEAGPTRVEGSTVVVPLRTDVPVGEYTLAYRVTSQDGHPISGGVTYRVTTNTAPTSAAVPVTPNTPAPPTAQAAPLSPAAEVQNGGAPIWPWLVGAILVVAAAIFVIRRIAK